MAMDKSFSSPKFQFSRILKIFLSDKTDSLSSGVSSDEFSSPFLTHLPIKTSWLSLDNWASLNISSRLLVGVGRCKLPYLSASLTNIILKSSFLSGFV